MPHSITFKQSANGLRAKLTTDAAKVRGRSKLTWKRVRAACLERKLRKSIRQAFLKRCQDEDKKENLIPQASWDELFESAFAAIESSDVQLELGL